MCNFTAASPGQPSSSPRCPRLGEGEAALERGGERLITEVKRLGETKLARLAGNKGSRPRWRAIGLDAEASTLDRGAAPPAPSSPRQRQTRRMAGASLKAARVVARGCATIRSGEAPKSMLIKPRNPSKKACISLDSFGDYIVDEHGETLLLFNPWS